MTSAYIAYHKLPDGFACAIWLLINVGLYLECSGWGVTGEQGIPSPPSLPLS